MKKKALNILFLIFTFIILPGCGGGTSGTTTKDTRSVEVFGRVVDAEQNPLANVEVSMSRLFADPASEPELIAMAETDKDGKYSAQITTNRCRKLRA